MRISRRPQPLIAFALLSALALGGCDWLPSWGGNETAKPKYDPVDIMIMARLGDLRSIEPEIHKQAVRSLAETGPRVVPKIIPLLSEENSLIRSRAAEVLGRIGPAAKDGVPALVERLKARNDRDMEAVLKAVAQIGPEAGAAVPELVELIRDKKRPKEHRRLAGKAIIRIGAPAVPTLIPILSSDPDAGFRHAAARALAKMGAAAEPARAALVAAKKDPDDKVKFWARKAIESLDGVTPPEKPGEKTASSASGKSPGKKGAAADATDDDDEEEQAAN